MCHDLWVIGSASWLKAYLLKFKSEHIKHNKHFSLSVDAGVQDTLFDPNHLTQILNNLCENALKYSDVSNQPIRLKVSTYFNQPTIKVIDYGPGVPEASVKNLFEPFFTSSSTGTGLGLYISRGLAELNKGVLSYHSLKNEQGCYFRLCMMNAEQKIIQL